MDVTTAHNRQNAKLHHSSRRWKVNMACGSYVFGARKTILNAPVIFIYSFFLASIILNPLTNARSLTSAELSTNEDEINLTTETTQVSINENDEFPPTFQQPENLLPTNTKPPGSIIRLSCAAIGNPEPTITWTRNGLKVYRQFGSIKESKWSIEMENLVPADSGVYACNVCNPHGCIERSTKLTVSDRANQKPLVTKAALNLTLQLNGSGKMSCQYLTDLPSQKVWTFTPCNSNAACAQNSSIIESNVDILEFMNVSYADEGWYTCIANNSAGQTSSTAYLHVVQPTEVKATSVSKVVRRHADMPDAQRRNVSQPTNNNEQQSNGTGTSLDNAQENAYSAPSFKNPKNLLNIHSKPSGSYIQLSCAATGNPEPTITWTRNGTKVYRQFGRIKESKWSIKMEDLVPEDSDIYACKVCNPLGCIEHSTKLLVSDRVNHKPIVTKAPLNLTLQLNGSGEMSCQYLSDLHSQKAWTFTPCNSTAGCSQNRSIIKGDEDVLEFKNVTFADEGWYTCIEINSLGQESSSAYLRVIDPSEVNDTSVTKIVRSHAMWVAIVVTVIVLLLLLSTIFIVYVLRKLKHEKLLKQRIETVHQWTKKVIIYKPASGDSSGSMDTMIMPVVKIEKQRTTVLQSSNSEPAPFNEYEFPLDSNWEKPRSQLILGPTLGEGAFGRVVKADLNNCTVAVKMVKEGHTDDDIASLVREMEVMKIIGKHINIINLIGCCSQSGPLYVIVEFALHGNLKDFLYKNRPAPPPAYKDYNDHSLAQPQHHLTEKHLISFAFQIARGMEYLASRRCIHRDLAARNVLVSDDYVMKIADFGLARDIQDTDYYRKNTNGRLPIKWMAPESLQDKFYDSQSDVWSYGILLWEIMTFGAQPYPTIMSAEELYSYLMSGQRMEKPPKCSLNIYMLMRQCWHFDASARPTFTEIVENLDKLLLANEDYLDVAVANLDTPPSSSDEESDVESLRYHYK